MRQAGGLPKVEATAMDLEALFAPSEPPSVSVFLERMPADRALLLTMSCCVCRGGARAKVSDETLESARSMTRAVSDVLFGLADVCRGHVCPGHDPGDEDRS